jgi:hypothetical protein
MKNIIFLLLITIVGCCSVPKQEECQPYHYHIELQDSVMIITEHGRFVASVPYEQTGVLDSIFVDDNE